MEPHVAKTCAHKSLCVFFVKSNKYEYFVMCLYIINIFLYNIITRTNFFLRLKSYSTILPNVNYSKPQQACLYTMSNYFPFGINCEIMTFKCTRLVKLG